MSATTAMTDRHHSAHTSSSTWVAGVTFMAAASGIGAYVLPLAGPWLLGCLAVGLATAGLAALRAGMPRWTLLVAVGLTLAAVGGIASAPVATALIACLVLATVPGAPRTGMALTILALQLSYTATVEALISDALAQHGAEAAAPALTTSLGLLLMAPKMGIWTLGAAAIVTSLTLATRSLAAAPSTELVVAALPLMVLAGLLREDYRRWNTLRASGLCLLLMLSWNITPPRMMLPLEVHLLVPTAPDAPEAHHFAGLAEGLAFAGLRVRQNPALEGIPTDAVVILPWLSVPIATDESAYAERFHTLANERRWTVILFGDHTGMGGLDGRIRALVKRPMFRRDLTVPPGNTDHSGPLRSADAAGWPPWAIFNRGASTDPHDARTRILLAGDGWFADPDLHEWLWTGDYRWRRGDRGGRLPLAQATTTQDGATWVAVGDTSAILTRQLVADPRPVLRLLELASLRPAFALDAALSLLTVGLALRRFSKSGTSRRWLSNFAVVGAGAVLLASVTPWLRLEAPKNWRVTYIGEGGFEVSNFNLALANEPRLLSSGWRFARADAPLRGTIAPPTVPTITFGVVDGSATLAGTSLASCWRLGALDVPQADVRLMDAQACAVEGSAEVLIGERGSAAALRMTGHHVPWIVVLDRGFLNTDAPPNNAAWLLRTIGERRAN